MAEIDYAKLEYRKSSELDAQIQQSLIKHAPMGDIDSLHHTILKYVVEGNYDLARSELDRYVAMKKNFPTFEIRASSYIKHCHDVMSAIRTKRSFPAMAKVSVAKNQELFERILAHFEELKHYLKKIEIIDKETKLDDLRSTVFVVKALFYSVLAMVAAAFAVEFMRGHMDHSFSLVLDDLINKIMNLFGF